MSKNKTDERRSAAFGAAQAAANAEGGREPDTERPLPEKGSRAAALAELEEAASLGSVPELLEFIGAYPDVHVLPEEVLDAVKGGKKLMQAYAEYENAKLRDELTAQKQNRRNAERTPGSVRSDAGEDGELEELLAVFDSVFR